ncbi:hypothetical protein P280DRAFT_206442 [Massarina eburnea CBS 473.64]|uniref:Uncharacterized protein n=1 Tax=Massarina eburnea CBS 473.64 TaxID=1395130 RepID=A0A6A6RI93_9PLEO|nr:hypothetical protein P280DRAFT_206442 [Massarina eburnea CBS 473.64]
MQYAVFRFKYRSPTYLRSLFGSLIPYTALDHPLTFEPVIPRPISSPAKPKQHHVSKEALETLPREALVDSVLKLHTKMEAKKHATKAKNGTAQWVVKHSGDDAEKEKKHRGSRSEKKSKGKNTDGRKKENEVSGWGDGAGGGATWGTEAWA